MDAGVWGGASAAAEEATGWVVFCRLQRRSVVRSVASTKAK